MTHLVEDDVRPRPAKRYRAALAAEPDLFEALYGLAVLEQDAGRPAAALASAAAGGRRRTPTDVARPVAAARSLGLAAAARDDRSPTAGRASGQGERRSIGTIQLPRSGRGSRPSVATHSSCIR